MATGGGAAGCDGTVVLCGPFMPSLKFLMPSPEPRASLSGIFFPAEEQHDDRKNDLTNESG